MAEDEGSGGVRSGGRWKEWRWWWREVDGSERWYERLDVSGLLCCWCTVTLPVCIPPSATGPPHRAWRPKPPCGTSYTLIQCQSMAVSRRSRQPQ